MFQTKQKEKDTNDAATDDKDNDDDDAAEEDNDVKVCVVFVLVAFVMLSLACSPCSLFGCLSLHLTTVTSVRASPTCVQAPAHSKTDDLLGALDMPSAIVGRLIKDALPSGCSVTKDGRAAVSRATTMFILKLLAT